VGYPKKFDLVHQTISPRERVGSGDETRVDVGEKRGFIVRIFPEGLVISWIVLIHSNDTWVNFVCALLILC